MRAIKNGSSLSLFFPRKFAVGEEGREEGPRFIIIESGSREQAVKSGSGGKLLSIILNSGAV